MLAASSWCSIAQPQVIIIIIIQPRVSRASSAPSAAEEGMPQHGVLRCILYSQLTVAMGSPPQVAWRLLSPSWSRRRTTSSFTNNLPLTHHFFLTVPRPLFSSTALYTWYNSWSVFLWRKGRRISSSSGRLHFATHQTHHPPARCSRTSWVINVVLNNIHQQYPVVELACQAG